MQTVPTADSIIAEGQCFQPDSDLISDCLAKKDQAWMELLDRYGSLVYSIAWRHGLSHEGVAEVFQSVCLELARTLGTLQGKSNLSGWLTEKTIERCGQVAEQRQAEDCDMSAWREDIQKLEKERMIRQALLMMEAPCRSLLTNVLYGSGAQYGSGGIQLQSELGCCLRKLIGALDRLGFYAPDLQLGNSEDSRNSAAVRSPNVDEQGKTRQKGADINDV